MSYHRRKGIGLVELMLALAIIAVLIVMGTRYFKQAKISEQVNTAVQNIQALYAAYSKCSSDKAGLSGSDCSIQTMVDENYLPAMYALSAPTVQGKGPDCSAQAQYCLSGANPWGGALAVSSSTKAGCQSGSSPWTVITIYNVPTQACTRLVDQMAQTLTKGQCIRKPNWEFGQAPPVCGGTTVKGTTIGIASPTFNM